MDIEIVVENELLKSFTAKYKSTTGFDAEISKIREKFNQLSNESENLERNLDNCNKKFLYCGSY